MLCFAGCVPVQKDDHATGEMAGRSCAVDGNKPLRPSARSAVACLPRSTVRELGILAIEPHDDESFDVRLRRSAVSQPAPAGAKRPHEKRHHDHQDGGDQDQGGCDQREAGAGPM